MIWLMKTLDWQSEGNSWVKDNKLNNIRLIAIKEGKEAGSEMKHYIKNILSRASRYQPTTVYDTCGISCVPESSGSCGEDKDRTN